MNAPSERTAAEQATNRRATTENAPVRPPPALGARHLWPTEARTAFLKIL